MKQTIKEQCKEVGISKKTYYDRRKKGMSHTESMTPKAKRRWSQLWYKGRVQSASEWCKEFGVPYEVFMQRVYSRTKSWSLDRALETPVRKKSSNKNTELIEINGEKRTIRNWCRLMGVPVSTYRARVQRGGWSIQDALTTPPKKRGF